MDKATLQKKLDEFVALGNELHAEAKRRYGKSGSLFHEADGGVYIMTGDSNGPCQERQQFIAMSTKGNARWGAGAW